MRKLEYIKYLDINAFQTYLKEEHNYTQKEWDKLWKNYLANIFIEYTTAKFIFVEDKPDEFDLLLNQFFEDYPELEKSVNFIFTD